MNLSSLSTINFKRDRASGLVGEMADIKITLETLYDILRNEKKREDLQKIEATFFLDVVSYLREKQALLESKQKSTEVFAIGERDKLEYELRSIKRILKEIYEKREKKILDIALNRSRTGSDIIDTSAMLFEEKEFYQRLLFTLNLFREGILMNMFNGRFPELHGEPKVLTEKKDAPPPAEEKYPAENKNPNHPERRGIFNVSDTRSYDDELRQSNPTTASSGVSETNQTGMTRIKFIHPTPSFVWKDMKVYGPFDPGEEIEIYPEVADLIVRKGRAVKV